MQTEDLIKPFDNDEVKRFIELHKRLRDTMDGLYELSQDTDNAFLNFLINYSITDFAMCYEELIEPEITPSDLKTISDLKKLWNNMHKAGLLHDVFDRYNAGSYKQWFDLDIAGLFLNTKEVLTDDEIRLALKEFKDFDIDTFMELKDKYFELIKKVRKKEKIEKKLRLKDVFNDFDDKDFHNA